MTPARTLPESGPMPIEAVPPAGLPEQLRAFLKQGAEELSIALDDEALGRFDIYLRELLIWNKKHNLTAIREPSEIVARHFLDSLTCTQGYDFTIARQIIDVGAGAGFPGLPLKIAFPSLQITLLDSSIKKVEFLTHLCPLLGFPDVDVVHCRAEEFGHVGSYRQRFYLAVARAVAPLPVLAEFCLPFVTVGGYFLAQKNLELGEELTEATKAFTALGGGDPVTIPVTVPGTDLQRSLIRVRKESPTPSRYPRRPGIPAKRPIGTAAAERMHPKYR